MSSRADALRMPEELTGTYRWTRHRWPNHGAGPQDQQPDTIIGNLHDGTVVKGLAFDGELERALLEVMWAAD